VFHNFRVFKLTLLGSVVLITINEGGSPVAAFYKTYTYPSDNGTNYSIKLSVADAALTDLVLFGTGAVNPYPKKFWKIRGVHVTMTSGLKKFLPCSASFTNFITGNGAVSGGVVTGARGESRPRTAPGS
jgi:hypothetical protein